MPGDAAFISGLRRQQKHQMIPELDRHMQVQLLE
jgi:hypothetical protein